MTIYLLLAGSEACGRAAGITGRNDFAAANGDGGLNYARLNISM
jgi:hypothetical protein